MLVRSIATLLVAVSLAGCGTKDPSVTLEWRDHPDLGQILTDGAGLTLYIFTNDEGSQSTCYGDCAVNWPPLLEASPTAAADVAGELGTTTRDGGGVQVTYDGQPLYYFQNDAAPGDANGQGVGGIWFVIEA